MKKLLIVMLTIGLALGASAQKVVVRGGGYHHARPRMAVGVGLGYAPFYPYYGYYSPWYYPPYGYNYSYRPSRLELTIQDIKVDYADRIKSVRMQDGISRHGKRQEIQVLRHERDKAIVQAQKDYYYKRLGNRRPLNNSNSDHNNDSE
jgi:hypothetical protein